MNLTNCKLLTCMYTYIHWMMPSDNYNSLTSKKEVQRCIRRSLCLGINNLIIFSFTSSWISTWKSTSYKFFHSYNPSFYFYIKHFWKKKTKLLHLKIKTLNSWLCFCNYRQFSDAEGFLSLDYVCEKAIMHITIPYFRRQTKKKKL